jgi:hypothetical protein
MMDSILAAGLFSIGRNIAGNLIGALTQPESGSFQSVLANEVSSATKAAVPAADLAQLRSSVAENEQLLASTKEVQNFVGRDASFTVRPEAGGAYSIVREDGMQMRLPRSSMAEKYAAALNSAQCSLIRAEGGTVPALADCAWEVQVDESVV